MIYSYDSIALTLTTTRLPSTDKTKKD